jgi:hypothetical protein
LLSPEADRFYVTFPGKNEDLVKAGIKDLAKPGRSFLPMRLKAESSGRKIE